MSSSSDRANLIGPLQAAGGGGWQIRKYDVFLSGGARAAAPAARILLILANVRKGHVREREIEELGTCA